MSNAPAPELYCPNCQRRLDPTDKFCRDCGLPTVRQAEAQRRLPENPPDTAELQRNLDVPPEPAPFQRGGSALEAEQFSDSTGSVVRATSPTAMNRMAHSTALMVGLVVLLAVIGFGLLIAAYFAGR